MSRHIRRVIGDVREVLWVSLVRVPLRIRNIRADLSHGQLAGLFQLVLSRGMHRSLCHPSGTLLHRIRHDNDDAMPPPMPPLPLANNIGATSVTPP